MNRLMRAIFFWAASTSFRARAMMLSSSDREMVRATWSRDRLACECVGLCRLQVRMFCVGEVNMCVIMTLIDYTCV